MLFIAAQNSCEHVTGYEIDEIRYEILINNIQNYQNKFGKKTVFSIYRDAQNMKTDDVKDTTSFSFLVLSI